MTINYYINALIMYAFSKNLIEANDITYMANRLIHKLGIDEFTIENTLELPLEEIVQPLFSYACSKNLVSDDSINTYDMFEADLIDVFMDKPSEIIRKFKEKYDESPKNATNYLYDLAIKTNYIKVSRIKKNISWIYKSSYANYNITINLSKPEKDPREIMKVTESHDYPKCALCKENEGYFGNGIIPARSNHRIIPITLDNELWYLQYSPYSYFNEHCIVLKDTHTRMNISERTFVKLLDFLDIFPHYVIGSNAGLPIVGGSILAHDHFQGGRFHFPIQDAKVINSYFYSGVTVEILYWPMSVIRLRSVDRNDLLNVATIFYNRWLDYNNPDIMIFKETDGEPHNAITPIARMVNGEYEMDLILRNNITTKEYPDGYFHPHQNLHNIKKENIGLIEVMGVAILPPRLKSELDMIKKVLKNEVLDIDYPELEKHQDFINELIKNFNQSYDLDEYIEKAVGHKFELVLKDCAVFKDSDYLLFRKFVEKCIDDREF